MGISRWASAGRAETVLMRFPDVLCFLLTPEDAVPPLPPSSCDGLVGLWRGAGGGECVWLCPGGDLAKLELNAQVWQQEGSACDPEARGVASGRGTRRYRGRCAEERRVERWVRRPVLV